MSSWIVIEDEPDIYEMVLAMYTTLGVDGVPFTTGEDAFDWIDAVDAGMVGGEMPELALIDIRLPGEINGVMVGERLRQSPYLQDMAIILMTAYHLSPEDEQLAQDLTGAELLLYKPLPGLKALKGIFYSVLAGV